MKYHKLSLLILPVLALTSCARKIHYEPKPLDPSVTYDNVYLIMGQSNASGVASYSFLKDKEPQIYQRYSEGNSKVLISYDTYNLVENNFVPTKFGFGDTREYFGPEIGMAEVLSQKEETSYIIKASKGGVSLREEYVSQNGVIRKTYKRFIAFIINQLKVLEEQGKNPRVKGVFFMQGESDSLLSRPGLYRQVEQYFFEYLRMDLNPWIYDHFNFVDAYISTKTSAWVNPGIINSCKQDLVDTNDHCYCIHTNGEDESAIDLKVKSESGEDEKDNAHYDSSSMLLLGKTAATLFDN